MHTSSKLASHSFELEVDGRAARLADVLPGFHHQDRLGIVVREPCGAVGASTLLLAAVTGFFDFQRARSDDFFIYPDYFLFHIGERWGDFNMVDIWPDHKEVVVSDADGERLLQAINDRGVTRLLVPDDEPSELDLTRHTRSSAEGRIVTALAYSPRGRVRDPDVTVRGNDVTESYVRAVLDQSEWIPAQVRTEILAARSRLITDGRPTENYRRIELPDAFARLCVSVRRGGTVAAAR
jgi:hypothetical protein